MAISLNIEGLVEGTEGERTIQAMVCVFEKALNVALVKEQAYGGAWRKQGWMGNLARVMSKTARLKALLWCDPFNSGLTDVGETVYDTLVDLINLAAFMDINLEDGNRWGQ